jgi:hypothetical protein
MRKRYQQSSSASGRVHEPAQVEVLPVQAKSRNTSRREDWQESHIMGIVAGGDSSGAHATADRAATAALNGLREASGYEAAIALAVDGNLYSLKRHRMS